jgi:CSLREA domain-containing protein
VARFGSVDIGAYEFDASVLPPVAVDDTGVMPKDTPTVLDVLVNDTDPAGEVLTVVAITQGAHGTVVNNGSDVTYTPAPGYTGADSFTYTIADDGDGTDTATVTLTVVSGVLVVNSTADGSDATPGDGTCSTGGVNSQGQPRCTLRAAIQESNAFAGAGAVTFSMPATEAGHSGGVWTIAPTPIVSPLLAPPAPAPSRWTVRLPLSPDGATPVLADQPVWVVAFKVSVWVRVGSAEARAIVHTPPECPDSVAGIEKVTAPAPAKAFDSWMAARSVHRGWPWELRPPVEQIPSPGVASEPSAVELTTSAPLMTMRLTVAVSVPSPSSEMVYVKLSAPVYPGAGL